jgi:uncharacterized protein (DUF3820 family)
VYFVNHEDSDDVYKIPTKKLIEICETSGRKCVGGDNNLAKMYLLKTVMLSDFLVNEKKHKPIDVVFQQEVMTKLPFGKYRGQDISEIWKTPQGRKYLKWLTQQDWFAKFKELKNGINELISEKK